MPDCPLCNSDASVSEKDKNRTYYLCTTCKGIFVPSEYLPQGDEEMQRYETHNNDVNDPGYQQFVKPIVDYVTQNFAPSETIGLDYGAGPGPVAAKLLSDIGFQIKLYDPFFADQEEVLNQTYDFIICSEVMEHFHHPDKEFERLFNLLKPGGRLVCMTALYDPSIDFATWHYKNDFTHVFFYQQETLEFIKDHFGFSDLMVEDRLIVFHR